VFDVDTVLTVKNMQVISATLCFMSLSKHYFCTVNIRLHTWSLQQCQYYDTCRYHDLRYSAEKQQIKLQRYLQISIIKTVKCEGLKLELYVAAAAAVVVVVVVVVVVIVVMVDVPDRRT
jgi:hypothetical protein